MKRIICLFAALMSVSAFASKARVSSLMGANHLVDTQTVFTSPSHILLLNPYLTFETGTPGTEAEGGIMRSLGAGKLLLYVGHQNSTESASAGDLRVSNGYLEQNNPVEAIYGFGNMAFGASLSYVDNKATKTKESTVVAKWGMNMDNNWVYAHLFLFSNAEKDTAGHKDKMYAFPYLKGGASFQLASQFRLFGELVYGQAKDKLTAVDNDIKDTNLSVGIEDRSLKTDTVDIYYGIMGFYAKREVESKDISAYKLPAFMGIEYPVVSWATVRASVQQNILLGSSKDETATVTDSEGINADTTVAAGLGLKYNNIVLDGSLTAATTGLVNGNQFMSQASLSYWF